MVKYLGHGTPLGAFRNLGSWLQRRALGTSSLSILDLKTFYPQGFPVISTAENSKDSQQSDASAENSNNGPQSSASDNTTVTRKVDSSTLSESSQTLNTHPTAASSHTPSTHFEARSSTQSTPFSPTSSSLPPPSPTPFRASLQRYFTPESTHTFNTQGAETTKESPQGASPLNHQTTTQSSSPDASKSKSASVSSRASIETTADTLPSDNLVSNGIKSPLASDDQTLQRSIVEQPISNRPQPSGADSNNSNQPLQGSHGSSSTHGNHDVQQTPTDSTNSQSTGLSRPSSIVESSTSVQQLPPGLDLTDIKHSIQSLREPVSSVQRTSDRQNHLSKATQPGERPKPTSSSEISQPIDDLSAPEVQAALSKETRLGERPKPTSSSEISQSIDAQSAPDVQAVPQESEAKPVQPRQNISETSHLSTHQSDNLSATSASDPHAILQRQSDAVTDSIAIQPSNEVTSQSPATVQRVIQQDNPTSEQLSDNEVTSQSPATVQRAIQQDNLTSEQLSNSENHPSASTQNRTPSTAPKPLAFADIQAVADPDRELTRLEASTEIQPQPQPSLGELDLSKNDGSTIAQNGPQPTFSPSSVSLNSELSNDIQAKAAADHTSTGFPRDPLVEIQRQEDHSSHGLADQADHTSTGFPRDHAVEIQRQEDHSSHGLADQADHTFIGFPRAPSVEIQRQEDHSSHGLADQADHTSTGFPRAPSVEIQRQEDHSFHGLADQRASPQSRSPLEDVQANGADLNSGNSRDLTISALPDAQPGLTPSAQRFSDSSKKDDIPEPSSLQKQAATDQPSSALATETSKVTQDLSHTTVQRSEGMNQSPPEQTHPVVGQAPSNYPSSSSPENLVEIQSESQAVTELLQRNTDELVRSQPSNTTLPTPQSASSALSNPETAETKVGDSSQVSRVESAVDTTSPSIQRATDQESASLKQLSEVNPSNSSQVTDSTNVQSGANQLATSAHQPMALADHQTVPTTPPVSPSVNRALDSAETIQRQPHDAFEHSTDNQDSSSLLESTESSQTLKPILNSESNASLLDSGDGPPLQRAPESEGKADAVGPIGDDSASVQTSLNLGHTASTSPESLSVEPQAATNLPSAIAATSSSVISDFPETSPVNSVQRTTAPPTPDLGETTGSAADTEPPKSNHIQSVSNPVDSLQPLASPTPHLGETTGPAADTEPPKSSQNIQPVSNPVDSLQRATDQTQTTDPPPPTSERSASAHQPSTQILPDVPAVDDPFIETQTLPHSSPIQRSPNTPGEKSSLPDSSDPPTDQKSEGPATPIQRAINSVNPPASISEDRPLGPTVDQFARPNQVEQTALSNTNQVTPHSSQTVTKFPPQTSDVELQPMPDLSVENPLANLQAPDLQKTTSEADAITSDSRQIPPNFSTPYKNQGVSDISKSATTTHPLPNETAHTLPDVGTVSAPLLDDSNTLIDAHVQRLPSHASPDGNLDVQPSSNPTSDQLLSKERLSETDSGPMASSDDPPIVQRSSDAGTADISHKDPLLESNNRYPPDPGANLQRSPSVNDPNPIAHLEKTSDTSDSLSGIHQTLAASSQGQLPTVSAKTTSSLGHIIQPSSNITVDQTDLKGHISESHGESAVSPKITRSQDSQISDADDVDSAPAQGGHVDNTTDRHSSPEAFSDADAQVQRSLNTTSNDINHTQQTVESPVKSPNTVQQQHNSVRRESVELDSITKTQGGFEPEIQRDLSIPAQANTPSLDQALSTQHQLLQSEPHVSLPSESRQSDTGPHSPSIQRKAERSQRLTASDSLSDSLSIQPKTDPTAPPKETQPSSNGELTASFNTELFAGDSSAHRIQPPDSHLPPPPPTEITSPSVKNQPRSESLRVPPAMALAQRLPDGENPPDHALKISNPLGTVVLRKALGSHRQLPKVLKPLGVLKPLPSVHAAQTARQTEQEPASTSAPPAKSVPPVTPTLKTQSPNGVQRQDIPNEWSDLESLVTGLTGNQPTPVTDDSTTVAKTNALPNSQTARVQRTSADTANNSNKSQDTASVPDAWSNLEDLVTHLQSDNHGTNSSKSENFSQSTPNQPSPKAAPQTTQAVPTVTVQRTPVSTAESTFIQRVADDAAREPSSREPSSREPSSREPSSREPSSDTEEDNDTNHNYSQYLELLVQEVYSLLRQRLSLERERRGPQYPR